MGTPVSASRTRSSAAGLKTEGLARSSAAGLKNEGLTPAP